LDRFGSWLVPMWNRLRMFFIEGSGVSVRVRAFDDILAEFFWRLSIGRKREGGRIWGRDCNGLFGMKV